MKAFFTLLMSVSFMPQVSQAGFFDSLISSKSKCDLEVDSSAVIAKAVAVVDNKTKNGSGSEAAVLRQNNLRK